VAWEDEFILCINHRRRHASPQRRPVYSVLSLSVDLYVGGIENEAKMTRMRLVADERVVTMATVAMTLVALTTALTELDGKMSDVILS